MLTSKETKRLLDLLHKISPLKNDCGIIKVIVTPTIYSPDDFIPRKKVCIDTVDNVVGEVKLSPVRPT